MVTLVNYEKSDSLQHKNML